MTTVDLVRPIPAVVADTEATCHEDYHERYGWPITGNPSAGTTAIILGHPVDAVVMSAELGRAVKFFLSIRMLGGPIISYPGHPERWAFLTQPATPTTERALDDLARLDVALPRKGALLLLPPSTTPFGEAEWVAEPVSDNPLAPWHTVVAAVRSMFAEHPPW
ncbi:hypothetical protein [Gandjariella thermophila]|uniref:DNA primase/polymerase bifunctional N-terminal domain-containing protein n=1 Tax=Gandjariella thermophila TaxID=1931992 RepID=A0A4D4J1D5_9PSEU|nr:hypothetical protein [Gandjariella thermophila]GDY28882.1 hypothetical protein GTS_05150 [Gandjariella thermophila]